MSPKARNDGVIDELYRIRSPRVFSLAVVVIIGNTCDRIEHHILQHRTEVQRVVDLWLVLRRESYALRVASTFKVKNATGTPSMLVVADQPAGRVCRQRRLAGARQSKKQSCHAILADVRRTMHGKDIAIGQQEVHDAENGLF